MQNESNNAAEVSAKAEAIAAKHYELWLSGEYSLVRNALDAVAHEAAAVNSYDSNLATIRQLTAERDAAHSALFKIRTIAAYLTDSKSYSAIGAIAQSGLEGKDEFQVPTATETAQASTIRQLTEALRGFVDLFYPIDGGNFYTLGRDDHEKAKQLVKQAEAVLAEVARDGR